MITGGALITAIFRKHWQQIVEYDSHRPFNRGGVSNINGMKQRRRASVDTGEAGWRAREDSNLQPSGYERRSVLGKTNNNRYFRACLRASVRVWLRSFIGLSLAEVHVRTRSLGRSKSWRSSGWRLWRGDTDEHYLSHFNELAFISCSRAHVSPKKSMEICRFDCVQSPFLPHIREPHSVNQLTQHRSQIDNAF